MNVFSKLYCSHHLIKYFSDLTTYHDMSTLDLLQTLLLHNYLLFPMTTTIIRHQSVTLSSSVKANHAKTY